MSIKTDNSFLNLKKYIRNEYPIPLKLLDCFSGNQILWKDTKKQRYYPIDKNNHDKMCIKTDNLKILKSLDLSKFNAIDLDAYGIPFKQLKIIFDRKFKGRIFFTFIQTIFGQINKELLYEYGITLEMQKQTRTIFSKLGFDIFKNYLAKNGIKKILFANPENTKKYYGYFDIE